METGKPKSIPALKKGIPIAKGDAFFIINTEVIN